MKRLFSASRSSVDSKEMKKFQLLAHKWWDEEGEYSALHSMNDIRVPFIRYAFGDRLFCRYCFCTTSENIGEEKRLPVLRITARCVSSAAVCACP